VYYCGGGGNREMLIEQENVVHTTEIDQTGMAQGFDDSGNVQPIFIMSNVIITVLLPNLVVNCQRKSQISILIEYYCS